MNTTLKKVAEAVKGYMDSKRLIMRMAYRALLPHLTQAAPVTENLKKLVEALIDEDKGGYDFINQWYGNGCGCGFKPSKSCPNVSCLDRNLHLFYEEVMK